MGADITFYDGEHNETFYFRDAYNDGNLAWCAKLSYWATLKYSKNKRIAFFLQLAAITDEDIKNYIKTRPEKKGYVKIFKKKRNDIKKHIEAIKNAASISWSV
jgi:hypothetical protein